MADYRRTASNALAVEALLVIGTGIWAIKLGYSYTTTPALLAILWQAKLALSRLPTKLVMATCTLLTFLAVILNLGLLASHLWRVVATSILFLGVAFLFLRVAQLSKLK
jgi:hypothetical protein